MRYLKSKEKGINDANFPGKETQYWLTDWNASEFNHLYLTNRTVWNKRKEIIKIEMEINEIETSREKQWNKTYSFKKSIKTLSKVEINKTYSN